MESTSGPFRTSLRQPGPSPLPRFLSSSHSSPAISSESLSPPRRPSASTRPSSSTRGWAELARRAVADEPRRDGAPHEGAESAASEAESARDGKSPRSPGVIESWEFLSEIPPCSPGHSPTPARTPSHPSRPSRSRSYPSISRTTSHHTLPSLSSHHVASPSPSPSLSPSTAQFSVAEPRYPTVLPGPQEEEEYSSFHESDTEDEGDGGLTRPASPKAGPPPPKRWRPRWPQLTTHQQGTLKCSIAYTIAGLFTFVPALNRFIGVINPIPDPSFSHVAYNAHIVATMVAYFDPAKTIGSMIEATVFGVFNFILTAFFCLCAIATLPDRGASAANLVIACWWIFIAMGAVAYAKVYAAKGTLSSAGSMACIIMSSVVVKEGGVHKLMQIAAIVTIGMAVSNGVCYTIWPASATSRLQNDINVTLAACATLLRVLTKTFLLDPTLTADPEHLKRAVDVHQASFTSLKKHLDEAKKEWFDPRIRRTSAEYDGVVDSMTRLAQHLTGLRSAVTMQRDILPDLVQRHAAESDVRSEVEYDPHCAVFSEFLASVRGSMERLTKTCTRTLKHIRMAFIRSRAGAKHLSAPGEEHDFARLRAELSEALSYFEQASSRAVKRVYTRSASSTTPERWNGSLDACRSPETGESIFVLYFFLFNLQELALELRNLVEVMGEIYERERLVQAERRTWRGRLFGCVGLRTGKTKPAAGIRAPGAGKGSLSKSLSKVIPVAPSDAKRSAPFPKNTSDESDTAHSPGRSRLSSAWLRLKHFIWEMGQRLRRPNIKFAVKCGGAMALLAVPAFIKGLRPLVLEWRIEWALLSCFVCFSPTVGQTNFLGFHRTAGTLLGAAVACLVFMLLGNGLRGAILLPTLGFFFSLPCFYLIVTRPKYAPPGRFILLTYNLTALYSFNLREKDIHPFEVAFRRSTSVIAGIAWSLIVSRLWWPFEARRELRNGLSDLCLDLGYLYDRLVKSYSIPPPPLVSASSSDSGWQYYDIAPVLEAADERAGLLSDPTALHIETSAREFMAMELHLQIQLFKLEELLSQTKNEPRLKGPFPVAVYASMLNNCQRILEAIHTMRLVTNKPQWYTSVRRDFILPVNEERREMVGSIILYFSILAAAFRLRTPLPPYLPDATASRARLLAKVREMPVVRERAKRGDSQYLLYFAYALCLRTVIQELEHLGRACQDSFGVIGDPGDGQAGFNAMFDGRNALHGGHRGDQTSDGLSDDSGHF